MRLLLLMVVVFVSENKANQTKRERLTELKAEMFEMQIQKNT